MVGLLLKLAEHMFGFCKNKEAISMLDLYLVNDYNCFKAQIDHIKNCFSSKIEKNKTGLLVKEEKGEMFICLFNCDGLSTIRKICKKIYIS